MEKNSDRASGFVAVAHFRDRPNSREDVGSLEIKTAVFGPSATIAEIFEAFWAQETDDPISSMRRTHFQPPFRIELVPDEKSIPDDED